MKNYREMEDWQQLLIIVIGMLGIVVLLSVVCGMVYSISPNINNPTSGEVTGQIVSIQKRGLIFKTNEIKIQKGGFSNGAGTISTALELTLPDNLLESGTAVLKSQETVNIGYTCYLVSASWNSDTGCFIDSINGKEHG